MFAKKNRLRQHSRIKEIFQTGQNKHGKFVFIKYLPNSKKTARLAVIVGTKINKSACKRNRLKRLLREALKQHLDTLSGLDILVIAKPTLNTNISFADLTKDINYVIKKL